MPAQTEVIPFNSSDRVRIISEKTLAHDWYLLKKTTFEYLRRDGQWQTQVRETYDRGNGAAVLLYNRSLKNVILVRQFRFPVYVNGIPDGNLIEVCAGVLDNDSPEACAEREATEETGYQISNIKKVYEAYMSPGSVTEKLFLFLAEYETNSKISLGGGKMSEGEDIEVLELPFTEALRMITAGEIKDAKTLILLQHLALSQCMD